MYWMPLFWLALTIVLIVIELQTFNLTTIWFAIGSIAATILAIFVPKMFLLQIGLFLGVSTLMLLSTRRILIKKLSTKEVKTNVNALVGKTVLVTEIIEEYKFGVVKVDGNYWTAKSLDGETIEVNERVQIMAVEGVKLIVKKI